MTENTTASADNGTTTTDAVTQQTPPVASTENTALTTEGVKEQAQVETTSLTAAETSETTTTEEVKDGTAKADTAPEKYEFKAPEGVQLDATALGEFEGIAKELGLSQEAAQKLVDKMAPVIANRSVDAVRQAQTQWKEAQRTDAEFGGDKFAANLVVARKAIEAFATPELIGLLNQTGLGDHPEVIRVFYRAGKAISEDTLPSGAAGASTRDPLGVMYPTMTKSA